MVRPPDRLCRVQVNAPISLWLIDLAAATCADEQRWLCEEELDRAARFKQPLHRTRYLSAHTGLRLLIERCCGIAPERQRLVRDTRGKWQLGGQSAWQLSLSYAGDLALVGIARDHAIGVDAEAIRGIADAADLAALHFDDEERAGLACLRSEARDRAFLKGWTRKEACLKAIGIGLARPPVSVHTGLDGPALIDCADSRVELASFATSGLIAAWARMRPSVQ